MFTKISLGKRLLKKLRKPDIYPEAFFAYFHRLPNELKISWFRDGKMIVGKVSAGNKEFMTQGTNPDDFIRMVNESLLTVLNVPEDYFAIFKKINTYCPSPGERALLEDKRVARSTLGFIKNDKKFKLA